ncbi:MAG: TonB-dependent receptor [Burkholderiaceae bacterium]|nr:TonB-dependent receptor [Burkholderiaceae bacterium]
MPLALGRVLISRRSPRIVLAAFGLIAANTACGAPVPDEELAQAYGDTTMVRIATGSLQPLRRAPAMATVITTRDIIAMGATGLDQVLESVPGLHVAVKSGGYATNYVMRGAFTAPTSPQVLLMWNGVPMTSVYTGDKGAQWTDLPLENVARIEIIRGPGSALYGADAFAGVINIITKGPAELRGTEMGLRAASFRGWDVWLQHGGALGPVQLAGYLRAGDTQGQRELIAADAATRLDDLFGTRASRAPGPVNTMHRDIDAGLDLAWGQWRLRSGLQWRPEIGTGAGINSALDPDSYVLSKRSTTELAWADNGLGSDWGAGASLSHSYYTEQTPRGIVLFPAGTRIGANVFAQGMIGGPNRWERQLHASAFASYSGWRRHALRLGLGFDRLELYASTTYKNFLLNAAGVPMPTGPVIDYSEIQSHIPTVSRHNRYVYVQDEWQFAADWALTAGLRHDRYSDFGGATNPRLALVWELAYNLTAKLLYGEAFRAPSFNEQFSTNPVTTGNLRLRPERMRSHELALDWQARTNLQLRLNLFKHELSELIGVVPNPAPAPGATYQNLGRQRGQGFELEAVWDARRDLRLAAQLSQQRTIDAATRLDAGYAPHRHVFARADWSLNGDWQLGGLFNAVMDRRRAPGDARPPIADYRTVDLNLRRRLETRGLTLTASVRNLFNAAAREPSLAGGTLPNDLPLARRSWFVEARYQFQ